MTTAAEHLLDELLQLPQDDRLVIAAILADSVQHEPTEEIEASWIAEAKRRLQAVREGRSTTIPTEVVEEELGSEAAWEAEIGRRVERLDRGEVQLLSNSDVLRRIGR